MISKIPFRNIWKVLKWILVFLSMGFIYFKLFITYKIHERYADFAALNQQPNWLYLVFAVCLMLPNWLFELIKWKNLTATYEPISFKTAMAAVFSGVALSIITPNQVGDFAGRILFVQKVSKFKAGLLAVIGHSAQVLVTLGLGLFAFWYLVMRTNPFSGLVAVVFGILFFLAFLLYFNMQLFTPLLARIKFLKKWKSALHVFAEQKTSLLRKLFLLSFLRYLTYLTQYTLLLYFFGVDIGWLLSFACIIATFFVQLLVPSFFLLELGLRGTSALWFMGAYSSNIPGILLASYSLWIINILFPAILGLYFIYRIRE